MTSIIPPKPVASEMPTEKPSEKPTSSGLLLLTLGLESYVFGSLFGWGFQRHQGRGLSSSSRKYLGYASVASLLLCVDRDATKTRPSAEDLGLFSATLAWALQSWFDRGLESFGPWAGSDAGKWPENNVFAVLALITHFRAFTNLFFVELNHKRTLFKRLLMIALFFLGSASTA